MPTKKIGKDRRLKVMLDIRNFIERNYQNGLSIQHLYGIFKEKHGFTDGVIRNYIVDMISIGLIEKADGYRQFYRVCKEGGGID